MHWVESMEVAIVNATAVITPPGSIGYYLELLRSMHLKLSL